MKPRNRVKINFDAVPSSLHAFHLANRLKGCSVKVEIMDNFYHFDPTVDVLIIEFGFLSHCHFQQFILDFNLFSSYL